MTAIYIRHAKDRLHPGDEEMDTSLTRRGKKNAVKLGETLANLYGKPDIIYCSPFRRTRQTAKRMASAFGESNKPPVFVDLRLSRYPGSNPKNYENKIRNDTKKYGFVQRESTRRFKDRMNEHFEKQILKDILRGKIVWVCLHALQVKLIAKIFKIPTPETIHSLGWINLRNCHTSWGKKKDSR